MVPPSKVIVRPRAHLPDGDGTAPLAELASDLVLSSGTPRLLQIVGGPGSGKTTALGHLAALPECESMIFLDEPDLGEVFVSAATSVGVVFTARYRHRNIPVLQLAPWSDDDLIEYLVHAHRDVCSSVIDRIRNDESAFRENIEGVPELWAPTLDQMAGDGSLSVRAALWQCIARRLDQAERRTALCELCVEQLLKDLPAPLRLDFACDEKLVKLIRHRGTQLLIAADWTAEQFGSDSECFVMRMPLAEVSNDLIREMAAAIAPRPRRIQAVHQMRRSSLASCQSISATLLHAIGECWQPSPKTCLTEARLDDIEWPGANLAECQMEAARLNGADLSAAKLYSAKLTEASLKRASLRGSDLRKAELLGASLVGADLSFAKAQFAQFQRTDLTNANFQAADLFRANLISANLTRADFNGANLRYAQAGDCLVDETDFTNTDFTGARLNGLEMHKAILRGVICRDAQMQRVNLEFAEIRGADFRKVDLARSWLTGSYLPAADFRDANLCLAGVAEVQWEQADLRGANLAGCQFHMGSSRSGLVPSPYPGHGSRTGFYTDTYDDRYHKAPEEIRTANLCGCDLRGAQILDADFYLVDLRGAKLDPPQREHLRRCQAILSTP